MIYRFLYQCGLILFALGFLPIAFYHSIRGGKYRGIFAKRFKIPNMNAFQRSCPVIWVHAVSLGETRAISPLIKKIQERVPQAVFIISSITETGFREAQQVCPKGSLHFYLPFDLSWIIRPLIRRLTPDLVLISETDFWFNFLSSCREAGAKIALVNGKVSEKSARHFRMFPGFSRHLFSLFDLMALQNSHYGDLFATLGISKEKIVVTGNIKFDREFAQFDPKTLGDWKAKFGIVPSDRVLVIGSTHDPEERVLFDRLIQLWPRFPHLKVLLVPRHPERFDTVDAWLKKREIPSIRYSSLDQSKGDERIVLVDAMGILCQCYQLAEAAIVAGSFTDKVGGHNILEPAEFGVPVLFGPHMTTQREMVELVNRYGAGKQVTLDEIVPVLELWLENSDEWENYGRGAKKMTDAIRGGADRTIACLERIAPFLQHSEKKTDKDVVH